MLLFECGSAEQPSGGGHQRLQQRGLGPLRARGRRAVLLLVQSRRLPGVVRYVERRRRSPGIAEWQRRGSGRLVCSGIC